MNSEDGQIYSVCILQFSCFTKYTLMQSKHKQTNVNIVQTKLLQITAFSVGITTVYTLHYIKELFEKTISNSSLC